MTVFTDCLCYLFPKVGWFETAKSEVEKLNFTTEWGEKEKAMTNARHAKETAEETTWAAHSVAASEAMAR